MKKIILLITLCTIFSLFACSCDSSKGKLADSTLVQAVDVYSPVASFWGELIHCGSDETEDYVFEIHTRHGSFRVMRGIDEPSLYVTDLVLEGSGGVYWWDQLISYPEDLPFLRWEGVKTFLEVFIRKDNKYVGYAVVAIERTEEGAYYIPTVVECKEVLQQEGSENELSKEELQKMIDKVIKKHWT